MCLWSKRCEMGFKKIEMIMHFSVEVAGGLKICAVGNTASGKLGWTCGAGVGWSRRTS